MKRSFLVLVTIFISGFFFSSEAGFSFKKAEVYPLYRLPDKDITIEWSTPSSDGITISYGGKQVTKDSEGKYVLPSSEISSMPETFEIMLKVNSKDGDEKIFEIQTFNEPREIKLQADQDGFSEKYLIKFSAEEWDSNLVIQKIELDIPQKYYIRKTPTSIEYIEIYTKWEYYNDSRNISGYLRWDNQYESKHDLPAAPKGIWTFRLWNYPWHHQMDEIQPSYLDPEVIFTIGAKQDSTISN